MQYTPIKAEHDKELAELIRTSLRAHRLDIPGTVYFDDALDHLSEYYDHPARAYYVLVKDGHVVGGIGLAELDAFPRCCELQKLYLDDSMKGNGIGYKMIEFIEQKAREMGYRQMYLETHTNLQAAIHIYEKSGFEQIERPKSVVHSTMNRFYIKHFEDKQ